MEIFLIMHWSPVDMAYEIFVTGMQYNKEEERYVPYNVTIKLTDKYGYYQKYYPGKNREEYKDQGFMGITVLQLGMVAGSPEALIGNLVNPTSNLQSFFSYITLPFQGLSPFPEDMTDSYKITGPLAILPSNYFWALADCTYWIFWLNFALGTFNVLPAIPLDGGYLFKDSMTALIGKINKRWQKKKREQIAAKITLGMSLLVLASILSLILIPRLKEIFL